MLDLISNLILNTINSCVRVKMLKAVKLRFSGFNPNLRTQGESGLNGFFVARVLHTIVSTRLVAWKNRLALYEPRRSSVNQATTKTGIMVIWQLAFCKNGLTIELIHSVDSRLSKAGYNVG